MKFRTTISAVIKNTQTDKYLLVKQPKDVGVYPGQWAIPGGGIEQEETYQEAIKREVSEEIGINIFNISPLRFTDAVRTKLSKNKEPIEVYMIMLVVTCDTDTESVNLNDEAEAHVWVSLEEALSYDLNDPTKDTFNVIASKTL